MSVLSSRRWKACFLLIYRKLANHSSCTLELVGWLIVSTGIHLEFQKQSKNQREATMATLPLHKKKKIQPVGQKCNFFSQGFLATKICLNWGILLNTGTILNFSRRMTCIMLFYELFLIKSFSASQFKWYFSPSCAVNSTNSQEAVTTAVTCSGHI